MSTERLLIIEALVNLAYQRPLTKADFATLTASELVLLSTRLIAESHLARGVA